MSLAIGLQLFSIRGELAKDFWGALEKVAEIGYRAVEFANHSALSDPGCGHKIDAASLKSGLDRLGLAVISSHISPITDANFEAIADYNKSIGNASIVQGMGFFKNLDDVVDFGNSLNRLGEKCVKKGLTLYYHNHFQEFQSFEGKTVYDVLIDTTDESLVKFEFDTYWAVRGGADPVSYLRRLGKRCDLVHQKDLTASALPRNVFETIGRDCGVTFDVFKNFSKVDYFTEVGEGVMDIKSIVDAAAKFGWAKYIIVEQDYSTRNELDSIALSFKNLKTLVASSK